MNFQTKTVADAYKALNRQPVVIPSVPELLEAERKHLNDFFDLTVVVQVINQEANNGQPWEPNYNDSNEKKWYGWFWVEADAERPSGFGFSRTNTTCDLTDADVGSRLCFKTEEALIHAQKHFEGLYLSVLLKLKS